jgi:hypothetical protein
LHSPFIAVDFWRLPNQRLHLPPRRGCTVIDLGHLPSLLAREWLFFFNCTTNIAAQVPLYGMSRIR